MKRPRRARLAGLGLAAFGALHLSDVRPVPRLTMNDRRRLRAPVVDGDAALAAHGAGPVLAGLDGQTYRFDGEARWNEHGPTWYRALGTPSGSFSWHLSPHLWPNCPSGGNLFVAATGFTFREPDPKDSKKMKSYHVRFHLSRKDRRKCMFNDSETCLAGGNLAMNLGRQARHMYHPGEFTLKTNEGQIRIVAYNVHPHCLRREYDAAAQHQHAPDAAERTPLDYLRQTKPAMRDAEGCEAWMTQREAHDDLFTYESDHPVVFLDTPWMQIAIEVDQLKVPSDDACDFAGMNVYLTHIHPELVREGFEGVLGGGIQPAELTESVGMSELDADYEPAAASTSRALRYRDGAAHVVDGPFPPPEGGTAAEAPAAAAPPPEEKVGHLLASKQARQVQREGAASPVQ